MSSVPERIDKYKVLDVAGHGAMGTVFVAHDAYIDRKVAIKVCHLETDDPKRAARARKMFLNEAQAAGGLEHPNILRIYDAGETDGQPFIVMEYIDGAHTLRPYCTGERRMAIADAVVIIAKCANALDFAHQRGVTHRDIKPANIMLARGNEPKVGDFGIAYRTETETTQVLTSIVSPRYMSPEQAHELELNHQTDLYSLGVTLYEMLAGQPPYDATNLPALLLAIATKAPRPLKNVRPEVPDDLIAVVEKAMAKERDQRYQSGADMARDLTTIARRLAAGPETLSESEQLNLLRAMDPFRTLSDAELEEVVAVGEWQSFDDGEVLFEQGDDTQTLYALHAGELEIRMGQIVIDTLGAGMCIGETEFGAGTERAFTAHAKGKASTFALEGPPSDWATIPLQVKLSKLIQHQLACKLYEFAGRLAAGLQDGPS